jgi:Uma2 family endonuclease
MSSVLFPADVVDYPDSDGQPMAESDFQREPLIYAVESLRIHFRDRPNVYVSGNMFVYYEQGNPKAVVAPDVFVVMGAPSHDRASYKLWQEPKAPDFVLEITPKSTYSEDQGAKRGVYALLGVKEYWQYDPTGDYLEPRLQGLQLIERNYWPLPVQERSGSDLLMHSAVLGLDLRLDAGQLRFHDPATGEPLRSHAEAELARRAAEQARQVADQARQDAEARAEEELRQRRVLEARLAELERRLRG